MVLLDLVVMPKCTRRLGVCTTGEGQQNGDQGKDMARVVIVKDRDDKVLFRLWSHEVNRRREGHFQTLTNDGAADMITLGRGQGSCRTGQ